jgi:hypothetical protein
VIYSRVWDEAGALESEVLDEDGDAGDDKTVERIGKI